MTDAQSIDTLAKQTKESALERIAALTTEFENL